MSDNRVATSGSIKEEKPQLTVGSTLKTKYSIETAVQWECKPVDHEPRQKGQSIDEVGSMQ